MRFHLFYVLYCSRFKCFSFNTSVCQIHLVHRGSQSCHLFGKVLLLGLPPVMLLFVTICLSIFPFDVWDKLWVLIRSVPEVSFII